MARTMATITERRAAAELRRRQAGEAGDRGGDAAFRQYRSTVTGMGRARRVTSNTEVRAKAERRNGQDFVHTWGYFTRYGRGYPMWDSFGEYSERVRAGAGARTLAAKPEVAFLTLHGGMAMARTTSGSLELREDPEGGWHDGWLNPKRTDVHDLAIAIDDKDVTQMSFAFMIPDGGGMWSEDFLEFEIAEYDIDGGDVSAVNFGANPYTDITAQTPDVLDALDRLPMGAMREAQSRIAARGGTVELARGGVIRPRIEVRHVPRVVDPKASATVRGLQGRFARTAIRLTNLAERNGLAVADLVTARLPWYEIRAAMPMPMEDPEDPNEDAPQPAPGEPDTTDVFIYEEIGGSFGVDAHQFAEDLAAITTPKIRLRVNSPGGSVIDAVAIHSSLLHHPAKVRTFVDGIAASAASVIALAADPYDEVSDTGGVFTMPGAQWMMHNASMTVDGQAVDLRKGATFLDRQSGNLADIYASRMACDVAMCQQMMDDETWMFAQEAVDCGMADGIGGRNGMPAMPSMPADDPMSEQMARSFDLSHFAYRYQSRADAPAPRQKRDARPDNATVVASYRPVGTDGSSPAERQGRSIALIEARLDMD